MSEFKGTPGPWTLSQYNTYIYQGDDVLVICDTFAEHQQVPDQYEREANSKLISCAPDLLEACKEALKELQFHNWQNTKTGMLLDRVIKEATSL